MRLYYYTQGLMSSAVAINLFNHKYTLAALGLWLMLCAWAFYFTRDETVSDNN